MEINIYWNYILVLRSIFYLLKQIIVVIYQLLKNLPRKLQFFLNFAIC